MKVSISFSIFLDLSISKEDAAMSMENMRLPYILLVVIRKKESTIIQPMRIIRSLLWICTGRNLTEQNFPDIR